MKYTAYLLRLWQERDGAPWRATLENSHTNQRSCFATLLDLVVFLEAEAGQEVLHCAAGPQVEPRRPSIE